MPPLRRRRSNIHDRERSAGLASWGGMGMMHVLARAHVEGSKPMHNSMMSTVQQSPQLHVRAMCLTFFIPTKLNNGRNIEEGLLQQVRQRLLEYSEGYTQYGLGRGAWLDGGQVCHDIVIPVQCVIARPDAWTWAQQQAAEMALMLEQKQIFVYGQPVVVVKDVSSVPQQPTPQVTTVH
jgi:hypothetical protein